MNALSVVTWRAAAAGRWIALVFGTLLVLFFLAFFFGEGPPNFFRLTPSENVQFVGMFAMVFGLVAAWKWEGWGGLACICGFGLLVLVSRRHLQMTAFALPAIAGAVHVLCWARLQAGAPANLAPWRLPRGWIFGLVGALVVFLLLCANEMFGEPPLMSGRLTPGPDLAAQWTGTAANARISIHPDGVVSGSIGPAAVENARIYNDRSWFGRLMHWRDDYRIKGRVGSDYLELRLAQRAGRLDGWLWHGVGDRAGVRITLRKD